MSPLDTLRAQVISRMGAVERTRERAMDRNDMAVAETAKARIDTYRVVLDMIGRISGGDAKPATMWGMDPGLIAEAIERVCIEDPWLADALDACPFHNVKAAVRAYRRAIGSTAGDRGSVETCPPDCHCWRGAVDAQVQTLVTVARDLSIGDQRTLIDLARRIQRKD